MKAEQNEIVQKIMSVTVVHDDFPKPGVKFLDIMPIISNPEILNLVTDIFVEKLNNVEYSKIFMLESRGFFFGIPLSIRTGKPCFPCRKKGKLPGDLVSVSYGLEYGKDVIEIQKNWLKPGDKVIIVDDVLATGGTMNAAIKLVEEQGATVQAVILLNVIKDLDGLEKLKIGKEKVFYIF